MMTWKRFKTVIIGTIVFLMIAVTVPAWGPSPLVNDADLTEVETLGYCPVYMIGPIAAAVILLESDGSIDPSTEDWTLEEIDLIYAKVEEGAFWWSVREPRADVTFRFEHYIVPTRYEPISRNHTDGNLWISDATDFLGFPSTRAFNQDLKARLGTDWAFTIYVVDSSNDPDGSFADGCFAYALLCGQYMVMTYDNDGYGSQRMGMVTAHEIGHIFGALDQAYGAHLPCTATSGILNIPNQNSDYGDCWLSEPSIMKFAPTAYPSGLADKYARGQVGWWDANCNGILDPIDPGIETDECFYVHIPLILRAY